MDEPYPKPLKAFTQIALAPLVAIFTGILYVYSFKIIAMHSWPRGWVALPVLLLSGVGILAALLLHPLRNQPEQRWARWFMHYFPRALAPLSVLLLLSLRERITAYGVTESRYLGMLVGGWLLAWSFVSVIWQNAGIRWVPVSLALACFMTSAGPWSAGSISRQSQLRQLVGLLERGGLMVDGKIQPPEKETLLPSKDYERLESTLKYLVATHGREVVREIFEGLMLDTSKVEERHPSWSYTSKVMDKLRLRKVEDKNGRWIPEYKLVGSTDIPLDGFRRARFFNSSLVSKEALVGDLWMKVENGALKARFTQEAPWENVPLDTFFAALTKQNEREIPLEKMTTRNTLGKNERRLGNTRQILPCHFHRHSSAARHIRGSHQSETMFVAAARTVVLEEAAILLRAKVARAERRAWNSSTFGARRSYSDSAQPQSNGSGGVSQVFTSAAARFSTRSSTVSKPSLSL
ncbi:MAG: DUF4153 domain-containing protein [Proteobacteria bacterium]|nr:DUF4153 domain-containing protein [Pseudomonadota bacterium]